MGIYPGLYRFCCGYGKYLDVPYQSLHVWRRLLSAPVLSFCGADQLHRRHWRNELRACCPLRSCGCIWLCRRNKRPPESGRTTGLHSSARCTGHGHRLHRCHGMDSKIYDRCLYRSDTCSCRCRRIWCRIRTDGCILWK